MHTIEQKKEAFERLLTIMDELRTQCPWDKKQTMESLRYLSIEELYELSDAILENDLDEVKGELGDLMLHMVFYAKIASEKEAFDIADVLNAVCDKLVYRHPHIYGDVKAETEEEVKANWEQLKLSQKKKNGEKKGVLSGVPKSLPAMVKAARIQEKVRGVGFDWDNKEQVWAKVLEELQELKDEVDNNSSKERIEDELGDVLFSIINYARFINVNPEDALERTNKKFISRFNTMEEMIDKAQRNMKDMNLEQLDQYWDAAKEMLRNK